MILSILLGIIGIWQILLVLLVIVVPLIALIDILRNEFTGSNKIIWLLVVLLLPILGSILYFVIGAAQKVKKA